MSQTRSFVFLLAVSAILLCPKSAYSIGFALPDQDAFATARGNAFAATADDPAAVFYNPAGISQLTGNNASLGAYGIVYQDTYHSPSGAKLDSKQEWAILPQVFSTYKLPYNFTFGFGTYSPYGLSEEWPDNSSLSHAGQDGVIDYIRVNPVFAYQINSNLSIAAGPTMNWSQADLKFNPGFIDHFRGRDTDVGYNVGILWHPLLEHSFGLTYRSATDMDYRGHATIPAPPFTGTAAATANLHFPQTIVGGYSFRPTTNWNFETDANWTDWSSLKTVDVEPFGETLNYDWKPSWMFDFGATRYFGNGWRASAGYIYSMNSVPDNTLNPLVPDQNRHIFSVGVGKRYHQLSWDVSYQFIWGPTRTVNDDGQDGGIANGSYEFLSHAISFNVGYHF